MDEMGRRDQIDRRTFMNRAALLTGAASALPWLTEREMFARQSVPGEVVETSGGKLRGTVHNGIYAFKGIPYGASTAGKNRFMAPAKPAPWTGVRDASKFGHQCPQNMDWIDILAPQADATVEGYDEDCLALNVWTPGPKSGAKRPVMFWCHGGGYFRESGTWPWVYGESLSRRGDAVVVSLNHRLNVFGYFHLGDRGGEKYPASGNAGMLDLVAGLQWVHDNIDRFGGDPGNVMIFGESGGGAKVSTLLTMPAAKGLFHRAVIESGAGLQGVVRENANELTEVMLAELGIPLARIDEVQTVPVQRMLSALAAVSKRQGAAGRISQFAPVVEGKIFPTHPFDPVASPMSESIPIIVGCNTHEQAFTAISAKDEAAFNLDEAGLRQRLINLVGAPKVSRVLETYHKMYPDKSASELYLLSFTDQRQRFNSIRLAERKYRQGKAPVYMYLFAWRSPALGGKMGSPHTAELPFVFDNTDIPKMMTTGSLEEKALAANMSGAWAQFARTGNPNHKGLPNWPAYDLKSRATMVFDTTCQVVNDPGSEARKLWFSI